jgi:flavorubredoxin
MFPDAQVVASTKGKDLLAAHLHIPDSRFTVVADGDTLELGGRTLQFLYTPWVHWPETMVSYLQQERILFSCDFFGSHLATTDLFVTDEGLVYEAAKRYYAEIMMPFRTVIKGNLKKIEKLDIDLIAPSHGPMYDRPRFIIDAYRDWVSDTPKNEVVIPFASMHGSTAKMVDYLVAALANKGVTVHQFDLSVTDLGKLAISLVDAATLIVGTPTVRVGAHPLVHYAANLANMIKPKLRYAAIIGSYGWRSRAAEQIAELIPNLDVELLGTVLSKGLPDEEDFAQLERLAETVAQRHKEL